MVQQPVAPASRAAGAGDRGRAERSPSPPGGARGSDASAPATLVRNSSRFRTWGLAELLIDESFRHRFDEPARPRLLADLGVELASRLDVAVYGSAAVNDLRARAWAMRGNALRLTSDLRGSARCLTRALKLLEEGSGDPLEEARVCELFAALRSNQRRVDLAVRLQERALRLYRRAGHRDRLGKAMVDLASYNALVGDRDRAIETVPEGVGSAMASVIRTRSSRRGTTSRFSCRRPVDCAKPW